MQTQPHTHTHTHTHPNPRLPSAPTPASTAGIDREGVRLGATGDQILVESAPRAAAGEASEAAMTTARVTALGAGRLGPRVHTRS